VSAMRWMAPLSCRLPVRLSRCRDRFDDQTGKGAVPFVACVRVGALEAFDSGGLAEDLGGSDSSAVADLDQRRAPREHGRALRSRKFRKTLTLTAKILSKRASAPSKSAMLKSPA
jgi:hypothetical protein